MALFFNKNKLDISTPSNFGQSLRKNSDKLEKMLKPQVWKEIGNKSNVRPYMAEVEAFAKSGNSYCQVFVAQFAIMSSQNTEDPDVLKFALRKAIEYGTMAAESGVVSEALNLPISLSQLSQILIEESGGEFTDEIEHIYREMYRWLLRNSKNSALPKNERERAGETARELYEGMPELYEGV
jgi:flagellin-specific chaperone FliS